jgi:hypothetical protein
LSQNSWTLEKKKEKKKKGHDRFNFGQGDSQFVPLFNPVTQLRNPLLGAVKSTQIELLLSRYTSLQIAKSSNRKLLQPINVCA